MRGFDVIALLLKPLAVGSKLSGFEVVSLFLIETRQAGWLDN